MYTLNEILQDPRVAAKWAAELEVAACEYRAQAARSRSHAISCEMAGKEQDVIVWTTRAEDAEEQARAIEAQRRRMIAQYLPPITIDVELIDDRGVAA